MMLPDRSAVWIIKACAVGVIALGLWFHGNGKGRQAVRAEWNEAKVAQAIKYAKALRDARDRELEVQAAYDAAAADWEKHRASIESERNKLAADLRAGRERLQPWWECKADSVPNPADAASVIDEQEGLRADSAGRIIAAVAECQAQRDGLISLIEAEHK